MKLNRRHEEYATQPHSVCYFKAKQERSWYMYIYFHPSTLPSSIANTCRYKGSCQTSLGVSAFYFDRVQRYCAVPWQHSDPHQDSQISSLGDKLGINFSHQVHTSSFPLLVESRWCFPCAWHLVIISWLWFKDPIFFAVELKWLWSYLHVGFHQSYRSLNKLQVMRRIMNIGAHTLSATAYKMWPTWWCRR